MSQQAETVRLHSIAHGRSGDKGNRLNVSVIAYESKDWQLIKEEVTVERVRKLFSHFGVSEIIRYELPRLHALNFVLEDALEGGVNGSLNLDTHGKCLSFLLLDMNVTVPIMRK